MGPETKDKPGHVQDDNWLPGALSKGEVRDMEARAIAGADQDEAAKREARKWSGKFDGQLPLDSAGGDTPSSPDSGLTNQPKREYTALDAHNRRMNKVNEETNPFSALKGKITKKRTITGILISGIIGGGLFGFSIIQGPAQFVQFAQLLQKFHLQSNEEFGDSRTSKVLLYALLGKGTERGRLGMVANKAADVWEKNLEKNTGLRPVYTQRTGRFLGYEITNQNKFESFMGGFDEKNTKKMERLMGKGVEIRTASQLDTNQGITRGRNEAVPGNAKIIDVSRVGFRERRILISTVGQATQINKVPTAIGTRLAKKRYGVDLHVGNKIRIENDKLETRKKVMKEWYNNVKNGVKPGKGLGKDTTTDANGNPNQSAEDQAATDTVEGVKKEIETQVSENAGTEAAKSIRSKIITRAGGAAAVAVGALCAAKDYGNGIQEYRYTNYVLPMMRIGMNIVSLGNQVMSGNGISMDDLNIFSDLLYDEENKTSWYSARSIQAERGEPQTGPDLPEEAQPGNISQKPKIFRDIDNIPVLGTACSISNFVSGLPVIKQVGDASSQLINSVTHLDDLVEKSFAIIAGQGIDPLAKGAEFGNLANVGTFLAGNDQAIAMGGAPLSPAQTAALKEDQRLQENEHRGNKSIAERYLNPYDSGSVFGNFISKAPSNSSQLASTVTNPLRSIGNIFTSTFSSVVPGADAAIIGHYDYGVPKYGFSLEDQKDDRFEDPYENAQIVEPMLGELNSKYGKCFSITLSLDDSGVHIESGDAANVFDLQKEDDCNPAKNTDPNFLRYRFYMADSVVAISMACYQGGDSNACAELDPDASAGGTSGSTGSDNGTGGSVSADAQQSAKQLLDFANEGKIALDGYSENPESDRRDRSLPSLQLKDISEGKKAKLSTRCSYASSLPDSVDVDEKLLQFLVDLAGSQKYTINTLAGQCHSSAGSNHHKGKAVDFACGLDTGKADSVGNKYGVSRNFETCGDHSHWHYSVGGN